MLPRVDVRPVIGRLHEDVADVSWRPRVILQAMSLVGGSIGSAQVVAERLCFRNRFDLARLLRAEGLPPLHELAGWSSVLQWVQTWQRTGESLCSQAFHTRRDPSACYRLVIELTGRHWTEVRQRGVDWTLACFLRRCREIRNFHRRVRESSPAR